jgi:hypothetical protein
VAKTLRRDGHTPRGKYIVGTVQTDCGKIFERLEVGGPEI